ncbi:hypothetical protein D9615_005942 [Tricholomella constricta]|uniref:Uncharacterized protein n=1 Tax=Tricholomella constricta TaxID=117010 RepID=A0A8H5H973_9AGAR|nr:hypothetical protein D9615_005942 [Tricholomella constricta]
MIWLSWRSSTSVYSTTQELAQKTSEDRRAHSPSGSGIATHNTSSLGWAHAILFLVLGRSELYVSLLGFVALGIESTLPTPTHKVKEASRLNHDAPNAQLRKQLPPANIVWLSDVNSRRLGGWRLFQVGVGDLAIGRSTNLIVNDSNIIIIRGCGEGRTVYQQIIHSIDKFFPESGLGTGDHPRASTSSWDPQIPLQCINRGVILLALSLTTSWVTMFSSASVAVFCGAGAVACRVLDTARESTVDSRATQHHPNRLRLRRQRRRIPVKASSFALVFLTDPAAPSTEDLPLTFQTSTFTQTINTATMDPEVLATSNGHSRKERAKLGSTSAGSVNGAERLNGAGAVVWHVV